MKKYIHCYILALLLLFWCIPSRAVCQDSLSTHGFCVPFDSIVDSTTFSSFPWYGNDSYLPDFLDQIGFPSQNGRSSSKTTGIVGGPSTAMIQIPVKAYIVGGTLGTEMWQTEANVNAYIKNVNKIFEDAGTSIRFYLKCEIGSITDNNLTSDITGPAFANNANIYRENGAITLFCVARMSSSDPLPTGLASNPWNSNSNGDNIGFTIAFGGATLPPSYHVSRHMRSIGLAHEFGHALGLLHTHNGFNSSYSNGACNNCRQESVSRTRTQGLTCVSPGSLKCTVTGDALCDTDADPLLYNPIGGSGYNPCMDSTSCNYNGCSGLVDNWGDTWTPPTHNLMSYGHYGCLEDFSNGQIGVMQYFSMYGTVIAGGPNPKIDYNSSVIDVFEPDNVDGVATVLQPGDLQHHTFHYQPLPNWNRANVNRREACDVDWMSFTLINPTTPIRLFTAEVPGQPQPLTKMELFDNTLTPIASSIGFNGTNFSEIRASLPSGTYLVRVSNSPSLIYPTPGSRGHYYVGFENCTFCCESTLFPVPSTMSSPTHNFNLGARYVSTTEYVPHDVVVSNSNLRMNDNFTIGTASQNGPMPLLGSLLDVKICNSKISIGNGGNLYVGYRWNQKCSLYIQNGCTLELKAGSHTYIRESSSIIIEPGGRLIIEPGAILDIEQGASLDQSGVLQLRDNANFTFTGAGFLKWGASVTSGQVVTGTNTSISLNGTGAGNLLLMIKDDARFSPDVTLSNLVIKNGQVKMGRNALVNTSDADFTLQNLQVIAVDVAKPHRGIQINGQLNHLVKNVEISHGIRGITAYQMWNQGAVLRLTNCNIHDCTTALRVHTKGVRLIQCNFQQNGTGYEQIMGSVYSYIGSSTIDNNGVGIQFNSSLSDLYIRESSVDDNEHGILFQGSGTLRSKCSSTSSNESIGIGVSYGATLDLSSNLHPSGSQHHSTANSYSIFGYYPRYLNLQYGHNDLVPAIQNIGRVVYAYTNVPVQSSLFWNAEKNHWNTRGTTAQGDAPVYGTDYQIVNQFGGSSVNPVYLVDPTRTTPPSVCTYSAIVGSSGGTGLRSCSSCRAIDTEHFSNLSLNKAVLSSIEACSMLDSTKSDSLVFSRLVEILEYPMPDPSEEEREILEFAYSFAKTALVSAIANGEIVSLSQENSGNSVLYYDKMKKLIENKIESTEGLDFQVRLDQALLGHTSGEIGMSLDYLEILAQNIEPGYEDYLQFADCYLSLENDMMNGVLSRDMFEEALAQCSSLKWELNDGLSIGPNGEGFGPAVETPTLDFYPSPSSADVWITVNNVQQKPAVTLWDMQGRNVEIPVSTSLIAPPLYRFEMNVSGLLKGSYLVRVQTERAVITKKLVVQ